MTCDGQLIKGAGFYHSKTNLISIYRIRITDLKINKEINKCHVFSEILSKVVIRFISTYVVRFCLLWSMEKWEIFTILHIHPSSILQYYVKESRRKSRTIIINEESET